MLHLGDPFAIALTPFSFQLGMSSFNARGSITAPDKICAPVLSYVGTFVYKKGDGLCGGYMEECLGDLYQLQLLFPQHISSNFCYPYCLIVLPLLLQINHLGL
jgi:hypothetical protein